MTVPDVLVHDEDRVRTVTLNRPDKLNALSSALARALSAELGAAAEDDGVRVVVIAGAGRSFCAGYDLDEEPPDGSDPPTLGSRPRPPVVGALGSDELIAAGLRKNLSHLLEVFDHPKPVIAQVHGHCLAGGCDLMMMCDLAVASEDALFGQPEIRFGSAIVAHVMPWLIGARRAKELVLTGFDRLDAATALEYGLVNRVVPLVSLREETMRLARRLAVVDPDVMRLTKRATNSAWDRAGFKEALDMGLDLGIEIETRRSPERVEFERIVAEQGLKEAIRWRDGRFRE